MSDDCQMNLDADYNLSIHIGSMFAIMSASFLGTLIPYLFKKYFSMSSLIFQCAKLLGAGVILSTAFNHLLAESFETLTSPCSGIEFYALAGVCTLTGVLFSLIVQLIASHVLDSLNSKHDSKSELSQSTKDLEFSQDTHILISPFHETKSLSDVLDMDDADIDDDLYAKGHTYVDSGHDHSHGGVIIHSNRVTAYLLELGIALHSVLIGVTLGLAREEFTNLFFALIFHQFFEGIGLSSVVSEAEFRKKWIAIGLVIFYSISTPIGIAIGIGLHESLNENAQDYLVTQGVLDGLCAGVLIYDSLVNMVVPHFNGKNYRNSSFKAKVAHIIALVTGSAAMALIAVWA